MLGTALDKEFQAGGRLAKLMALCDRFLGLDPPPDRAVAFSGELASSGQDLSSGSTSGLNTGARVNPDLTSVTSLRGQSSLSTQFGTVSRPFEKDHDPGVTTEHESYANEGDPASNHSEDSEEGSESDQSEAEPRSRSVDESEITVESRPINNMVALLSDVVSLATEVNPECLTKSLSDMGDVNSVRSMIGACQPKSTTQFKQSVDLVPSLNKHFASLKQGSPDPVPTDPLALPSGSRVHFPSTAPKPKFLGCVNVPAIPMAPQESDLPSEISGSSRKQKSDEQKHLRQLESSLLDLMRFHSIADAVIGTTWKALFDHQEDGKVSDFKPADAEKVHHAIQASAMLNFFSVDIMSRMMSVIVARRREVSLINSAASKELKAKLSTAPLSAKGLFGEVSTPALELHRSQTLNSALTSMSKKGPVFRPQAPANQRKRKNSTPRLSVPPPKKMRNTFSRPMNKRKFVKASKPDKVSPP